MKLPQGRFQRWRRRRRTALAGLLLSFVGAAQLLAQAEAGSLPGTNGAGEPFSLDPPAPPGARLPALAAEGATTVTQEHEILLTWLEASEGGERLRFSRLSEGAWSPPVTIADRVSPPVPGDPPSLTVLDTQGVRRTLIARTGDVIARTGNAGRTWTRLPSPLLPFASFAGGDEGGYAFWQEPAEEGSARLLGTRILAGRTILDPRVAAGVATAAAMTWDGPVVVYLDEDEAEGPRLALIRRQDARWTEPRQILGGSPVPSSRAEVGSPRVIAERRRVAVTWTEGEPAHSVRVAFSDDAGRSFRDPVPAIRPPSPGRGKGEAAATPALALDENGDALLLWLVGAGPSRGELYLNRLSSDGRQGKGLLVAQGAEGNLEAGHPQIVRAAGRVAIAWVEGAEGEGAAPGRLRGATLPASAVPAVAGAPSRPEAVSRTPPPPYTGRGRVGETVPGAEVRSLEGVPISLASLEGRVVILNFWATWCLPCLAEMPELAELANRYRDQGVEVVAVSSDGEDAAGKVRTFVSERQLPFAVWLDPEMLLYGALRLKGLPATFVLDRNGKILLRRDAPITATDPEVLGALHRVLKKDPDEASEGFDDAARSSPEDGNP